VTAVVPSRPTEAASRYAVARDVVQHVGTHVRHAREDRDLTQGELAAALGLSRHAVSRLETGRVVRSTTLEVALTWLELVARRGLTTDVPAGGR
jgi:ribosome-binding protein aMBF1 (putative translation factor)